MNIREKIARIYLIQCGLNDNFYFDNKDSEDANSTLILDNALSFASRIVADLKAEGYVHEVLNEGWIERREDKWIYTPISEEDICED